MLQKLVPSAMLLFAGITIVNAQESPNANAVTATSGTMATEKPKSKEEAKPALTISGSADTYYKYDFGNTKANNLTSFTNTHKSFALGMASVKLEHKSEKFGAVLDLGFGPRAKEFSYNDDGITQAIKQLYVTYTPASWIKFTAGSWATHVGYELVDPQLNRNYSMSYMFSYGPFFHTGLKADLTFGKSGFMVGVANPTDYKIAPEGSKMSFLAQYSYAANDNWKLYLNYVGGTRPSDSSKTNQFDAVVTGKFSDKFSLGLNGTVFLLKTPEKTGIASEKFNWWGAAAYLNFDPKTYFGLTLRSELYNDKKQLGATSFTAYGASIWANTLSANFTIGNLKLIPEFRFESGSEAIFTNKEGDAKKGSSNFLFAAVYSF